MIDSIDSIVLIDFEKIGLKTGKMRRFYSKTYALVFLRSLLKLDVG